MLSFRSYLTNAAWVPFTDADEVRALGELMSLDSELVWRHPFPGPGIAIRILGEVTPSQVEIARRADHIYIEEIKNAGLYRKTSQGEF